MVCLFIYLLYTLLVVVGSCWCGICLFICMLSVLIGFSGGGSGGGDANVGWRICVALLAL